MAKITIKAEPVRIAGDRTGFLTHGDGYGTYEDAPMGDATDYGVLVFDSESDARRAVTLCIGKSLCPMSFQQGISPHEARTLASALMMAADHADAQLAQKAESTEEVAA